MKSSITILFLIFFGINLYSQNVLFPNEFIYLNKDTLFFQWEVIDYPKSTYGHLNLSSPKYNGKICLTSFIWGSKLYVSYDNFKTWELGIMPGDFKKEFLTGSCLLPNNKVFVNVVDKESHDGITYETDDITKGWQRNSFDIFKKKPKGSIAFKDTLNGVVAVFNINGYNHLYNTEDGGKSWNKLDNISNYIYSETDSNSIERIEYLEESDILLCLIHSVYKGTYSFIFSKDFGKSWSELRNSPIKEMGSSDSSPKWGFYIRNDSLWFAGGAGTGFGDELSQFIYFSSDLGKTWQAQYLAIPANIVSVFNSVEFFDNSLIGLVCENSPRVLITFDGGNHWTFIRDTVTNYGLLEFNVLINEDFDKFKMKKVNNKMMFFGRNRIFFFNNQNLPTTGVDNKSNKNFSVFYNQAAEAIEIKTNTYEIINNITLYDITGKLLYSENNLSNSLLYITKDMINHTKVVFALIQTQGQTFIKQIICE